MSGSETGGNAMRRINTLFAVTSMMLLTAGVCRAQAPKPLSLALACPGKDCPLLRGKPQTAGMRSGLVRLKPGESVGWHSTGKNEETLIVLRGRGKAESKGGPAITFTAPREIYFPSETEHNVSNTGSEVLEYVYVVAPARP
jgi:mannose-6-phosphate isomerase-like protein (cupin superfamily)